MLTLNTLKPGRGARKTKKRLGRGIGSGLGKTCGKGHKGQKARSGGFHKVGFEGGQMPIQRRLPKFGFTSRKKLVSEEIRLSDLQALDVDTVDFNTLKAKGVIKSTTKYVKIFKSGELTKALTIKGLPVTKGAKAIIEQAGGKVEA